VSAHFAGRARETVVVVVGLFVEPGLHAFTHWRTEVAVNVQVLTEAFVSERRLVELRLTVLELAPVRPLLSQFRQLAVPTLCSSVQQTRRCMLT